MIRYLLILISVTAAGAVGEPVVQNGRPSGAVRIAGVGPRPRPSIQRMQRSVIESSTLSTAARTVCDNLLKRCIGATCRVAGSCASRPDRAQGPAAPT